MEFLKKGISALIVAAMVASSAVFVSAANAGLYMTGDADGSCTVDAKDAVLMKRNISDVGFDVTDGADVDRDGKITSKDALYLKAHFAGCFDISDRFPEGYGWDGFTIAGNPISDYEIIVTAPDNPNMVFAASELVKYVKNACGVTLPTVNAKTSGKAITLREGDPEKYGNDGFTLTVNNGDLKIEAGAKRGTMYAVYALLEDYFGYRFYGYNDFELLKAGKADIPEGTEDTQIPTVYYRCICIHPYGDEYTYSSVIKRKLAGCSGQWSMQQAKYGFGICRLFANAHSLDVFLPLEELYRATEDPEALAYMTDEQIKKASESIKRCLSQKEAYEICLNNMRKLLDERIAAGGVVGDDITEISISYAADEDMCTCRACNKVMRVENSPMGILITNLINPIDDILTAEYPGITVITNGYATWRKPPDVAVMNDDVILLQCWCACSNHDIGSGQCGAAVIGDLGSNKIEEAYFNQWLEHCSRIYIWYYPTNIYYLLCPQPNFFKIYNDFKWFMSHEEVEGFYVVGTTGSSFEDLDAYLISDLMWDTDLTRDEFEQSTKEFLKYYFGYGWQYVYEYMQMLDECGNLKGCVLNDFEQPFDVYSKEYFKEHFDEFFTLFDKAYAAAKTDRERDNIDRLSVHMKFLCLSALYEDRYVNGSAAEREEYAKTWRWTYDYINAHNIRVSYDRVGIQAKFTLDKSPMMLVYDVDGDRYQ